MLVYNHTTKVDHDVVSEWIQWQKESYIPAAMATGLCTGFNLFQLLDHDDDEGRIFVTQFLMNNRADYDNFISQFSKSAAKKVADKWGDKAVSFCTVLQQVE